MGKSSTQPSRMRENDDNDSSNIAKRNKTTMDANNSHVSTEQRRIPLSEIVSDCVERWFKDTINEAKSGDVNMQLLVGQMYYCGYGVPKDANKGKQWIARASKKRYSAWIVSRKRPGYTVSDSDSDSDELSSDS